MLLKKIIYLVCILLIVSVLACKSDHEKISIKEDDGVKVEYSQRIKDKQKDGEYNKYYASGEPFETSFFKNDSLEGERKIFYKNGTIKSIEHFHNGEYDGEFKAFFENGTTYQQGAYAKNAFQGELKTFYPNGTLKEMVTMADNEENGPFAEYYENGVLKAQGIYKDGAKEQGELKLYARDGQLGKIMDCNDGRCKTTWKAEGFVEE